MLLLFLLLLLLLLPLRLLVPLLLPHYCCLCQGLGTPSSLPSLLTPSEPDLDLMNYDQVPIWFTSPLSRLYHIDDQNRWTFLGVLWGTVFYCYCYCYCYFYAIASAIAIAIAIAIATFAS